MDERTRKRKLQARRRKTVAWATWYSSTRWREVRARFLEANPECEVCGAPSGVIDHIEPHRGDEVLFWNPLNWRPLCKSCHDRKTARVDGGFGNRKRSDVLVPGCDDDGVPLDPRHPWNRGGDGG